MTDEIKAIVEKRKVEQLRRDLTAAQVELLFCRGSSEHVAHTKKLQATMDQSEVQRLENEIDRLRQALIEAEKAGFDRGVEMTLERIRALEKVES